MTATAVAFDSMITARAAEPAEPAEFGGFVPAGLRASGAILLVSCYELGHQPLSLAAPLARLRAAGFDPAAVDTSVDPLPDERIEAAGLVAIAVPMHTALRLGSRVATRVRALHPAAHVCFYGLYATLNAGYLLADARLGDSVVSGEYEAPLLALAVALDRGDAPESVPGIGTRRRPAPPVVPGGGTPGPPILGGGDLAATIVSGETSDPARLDGAIARRLPPRLGDGGGRPGQAVDLAPDRGDLPPLRRYAGLERAGTIVQAGSIEATRGCHHLCRHCPIPPIYGGRFTVVPRPVVLADARAQIAAGARHLSFGDPDFFNGPGHGLRIARTLHDEFPWLSFDATIKVEHLLQHGRRLPELAELGCAFVVSAVESLSNRVLAKLAKGHDRAEVEAALAALDAVGVPMRPSLLPFTPWETLEGYRELLAFVAEGDLIDHVDPIQLAIRLLVPPGSELLKDPTSAEWLGELDAPNFSYRWSHPDPRMDALQREVSALVEAAAAREEPARAVFPRIWAAAHAAAGVAPAPDLPTPPLKRRPPPRLTESWFC